MRILLNDSDCITVQRNIAVGNLADEYAVFVKCIDKGLYIREFNKAQKKTVEQPDTADVKNNTGSPKLLVLLDQAESGINERRPVMALTAINELRKQLSGNA